MKVALCVHQQSESFNRLLAAQQLNFGDVVIEEILSSIEIALGSGMCILPREFCETQPYFKQLLPYTLVTRTVNGVPQVLTYTRGSGSHEDRLMGKLSVGFGGHIDDLENIENSFSLMHLAQEEAARELAEECGNVTTEFRLPQPFAVGVIYNDDTPVNSVHVGLIMHSDLGEVAAGGDTPVSQEVDTITEMSWVPLAEAIRMANQPDTRFESWSVTALNRWAEVTL